MRRAARVDSNQAQIAATLQAIGYSVLYLHSLGQGAPDLAVGGLNRRTNTAENMLVEIKAEKGALRPGQQEFFDTWRGKVIVARCVSDVLVYGFGWPEAEARGLDVESER